MSRAAPEIWLAGPLTQPFQHETVRLDRAPVPPHMFGCCRRRRAASTLRRWASLLRHVRRLRRLQRVFAYIGQHLSENYPDSLRRRLRSVFPTGRQAQLLG
jgi:hypothetical protein